MLDYEDIIIHCNSRIIPKYLEYYAIGQTSAKTNTRLQNSAYSMYVRILQIDHYK